MPKLDAPPIELVLRVLRHTDPDNLESLSRVNSRWTTATQLLQQQDKETKHIRPD